MGLLFMGCECKVPFELCHAEATDPTYLAIRSLVRKVGGAATSEEFLSFHKEYEGQANNGNYLLTMNRGDASYVVMRNNGNNVMYVARYNVLTGELEWEHTQAWPTATQVTFNVNGTPYEFSPGSGRFACGEEGVFDRGNHLYFTETGVATQTTPGVVEELDSDPGDGEDGALWLPKRYASHDYPYMACVKSFFDNYVATYTGFTNPSPGVYNHTWTLTVDAVVQMGYGTHVIANNDVTGVTVLDEKRINYSRSASSTTGSAAQPAAPSSSPSGQLLDCECDGFSKIEDRIIFSWAWVSSLGFFGWTRVGGALAGGQALNVAGAEIYEQSLSDLNLGTRRAKQVATVHGDPPSSSYAHFYALLSDAALGSARYLHAYDATGTEIWDESLGSSTSPILLSVNDTWLLLGWNFNKASGPAPDGRSWAGVTIGSNLIRAWMVRGDNEEWEPCRLETSATSWTNPLADPATLSAFDRDLIKTVEHPYGPPEDSYETTPP